MTRDERFDAILESDHVPEVPRAQFGRTLPFTKARPPLEEIYRLSQDAEKPAEMLLQAARSGADELAAALRALDGKPHRGFALLYAAQKGTPVVAEDPRQALALADAIERAAESVEAGHSSPAPREAVLAEAHLLRAQAHLQFGEASDCRAALIQARLYYRESGDFGFGAAMCDFFEGQAAAGERKVPEAQKFLHRALGVFTEFGQDHLVASAEAAIGMVHASRGDSGDAVAHLDRAIEFFDVEKDYRPLASALNNKACMLTKQGRYDEARATFARALHLARRHGMKALVLSVRTGLAELDFHRGQYARALRAFRDIASDASANGGAMDVLFARLYVAECLGRTGQGSAMASEVEAIRAARRQSPFQPSPALGELFVCLDQGTLDADLVAHVREYLEDVESGVERAYTPLRLVG